MSDLGFESDLPDDDPLRAKYWKTCTKCGIEKEINDENFGWQRTGPNPIRRGSCKACDREYRIVRRQRRIEELGIDEVRRLERESARQSRERKGPSRDRIQRKAYELAMRHLREMHREEFDRLYEMAKAGTLKDIGRGAYG